MVTKIAAEFYDPLPKGDSWCGIIFEYVTNPRIGERSTPARLSTLALGRATYIILSLAEVAFRSPVSAQSGESSCCDPLWTHTQQSV